MCLASAVSGGLVSYPNGALVPLDPANLAATNAHLSLYHYPAVGHAIWKRSADADAEADADDNINSDQGSGDINSGVLDSDDISNIRKINSSSYSNIHKI